MVGAGIERFNGSDRPAWFSPDGNPPDSINPDHLQYFITNPEPWYPSFEVSGDWIQSESIAGYFEDNYLYAPSGQGNNEVRYIFRIPEGGYHKIFAWWAASHDRTSEAPLVVNYTSGSTTVLLNQQINGGKWNEIGEFYFDPGEYSAVLSDDVDFGYVIADALRIANINNPPEILMADFYADTRYGVAPLEVDFEIQCSSDVTDVLWDFGDGHTATELEPEHRYQKAGTYEVTLTVTGPVGSHRKTKVDYITVGKSTANLQAEFSADSRVINLDSRVGSVPFEVHFGDESSGGVVSWLWDFGDGQISTEKDPIHIYSIPGNYTVELTVTNVNGDSATETKENFIRATIFDKRIDNVDYPKTHFEKKTIIHRKELEIPKEELKFSRMFYNTCKTARYYLETFSRGIVFYTVDNSDGQATNLYLKSYLEGKSDEEIWQIIQDFDPIFDYIDFSKRPWEQ
jgi:PKD repeat protein